MRRRRLPTPTERRPANGVWRAAHGRGNPPRHIERTALRRCSLRPAGSRGPYRGIAAQAAWPAAVRCWSCQLPSNQQALCCDRQSVRAIFAPSSLDCSRFASILLETIHRRNASAHKLNSRLRQIASDRRTSDRQHKAARHDNFGVPGQLQPIIVLLIYSDGFSLCLAYQPDFATRPA